ncbi:hypothetical protein CC86DRAFT_371200 [Ophiobolus disseminans]|uniref:Uncharacterized protein n=1 Tax=Ophiobolus disseminans TaxID=1469910 RepID=A0A6A6ZVY0_9PLEO|nr:hypothetical protein CC86DRAFT_371200 [Ophiobolus disseminans]
MTTIKAPGDWYYDRSGALGSKSTLVHLTTPMSINPGNEINVICDAPIKIELPSGEHLYMSAGTATALKAPVKMYLSPTSNLGPDFARGWNSLPDELKVMVLQRSLVRRDGYVRCHDESPARPLGDVLRQHLAMTPDIARLAHDVFYSRNLFSIRGSHIPKIPPLNARHVIRRIRLVVKLTTDGWNLVQSVNSGGFTSLKWIYVMFTWDGLFRRNRTSLQNLPSRSEGTAFMCSAKFCYRKDPDKYTRILLTSQGLDTNQVQTHIERLITFGTS